jgi:hypothetical protein
MKNSLTMNASMESVSNEKNLIKLDLAIEELISNQEDNDNNHSEIKSFLIDRIDILLECMDNSGIVPDDGKIFELELKERS